MSYISQKNEGGVPSLAAAIALNGSIIGAIMLSPIVVELQPEPGILIGKNVEIDKPPPPPTPDIQQPIETPKLDPVFVPDTVIDTHPAFVEQIDTGTIKTDGIIVASNGISDDFRGVIKSIEPPKPVFRSAVRDPRFTSRFQPDYPIGLLQREIEGNVRVKILIGTDGYVRQAIILNATRPEFAKETERKALSSWRFKPATRGGDPVEEWQVLTVYFRIN